MFGKHTASAPMAPNYLASSGVFNWDRYRLCWMCDTLKQNPRMIGSFCEYVVQSVGN